jgi:hypothetical protein
MYEWELEKAQPLQFLLNVSKSSLKESKIYHVHGSFGDVYTQCSVVNEVANQNQPVTVLIDAKYAKLISLIKSPNLLALLVDSNQVHYLLNRLGLIGNAGNYPIRLLPTIYPMVAECMLEGLLQHGDFLRITAGSKAAGHFLKLESEQDLVLEAKELFRKADAPEDRSILISADNNTQIEFSDKFWNDVCQYIYSRGWTPLINNSGTITQNKGKILENSKWPKINVPPHLATTMPKVSGSYIGGTNGFSTIQALFNDKVKGLHLINGGGASGDYLLDKAGNKIKVEIYFHQNSFCKEFLGLQKEVLLDSEEITLNLKKEIDLITKNI